MFPQIFPGKCDSPNQRCLLAFPLLKSMHVLGRKEGLCHTEPLHTVKKKTPVRYWVGRSHCLKTATHFFPRSWAHIACTGLCSCTSILFYL